MQSDKQNDWEIRQALDEATLNTLRPVSIALAGIFSLFVILGFLAPPPRAAAPLAALDAACGVLLGALWLVLRQGLIPARWSHAVGFTIAALVLCNVFSGFVLLRDPSYTAYVLIIVISAGMLMLSGRALACTLVLVYAAWIPAALYAATTHQIVHYGSTLISATVIAVVGHVLLRRGRWRLEALRLRDATARVKVVREKETLERQLRHAQKMETIGTLAGGVAHDMNNILSTILGLASATREETRSGIQLREDIDGIMAAGRRGRDLTQNLLGFARRGKFKKEPISLLRLTKDARRLLERTLPKGIEIKAELLTERAFIEGDLDQINNVLINLAVNAADAMKGSGTLTFTVDQVLLSDGRQGLAPGSYVRLTVDDTGAGMDTRTLEQAFDPFFTTKPRGEGTGLGLSAVYGTVRNHHGHVELDSEPGRGTTVTIYLPELECSLPEPTTGEVQALRRGRGTVLLVDDEELILVSGARLLRRLGYEVLVAASGRVAVELLREHQPRVTLVILDLNMPEMDGIETFRRLKAIDPEARVLLSSGYIRDAEQTQQLVEMGMLGFIQKPYDLTEISAELAKVEP